MNPQLTVYKGCRNKAWASHLSRFKKQLKKLHAEGGPGLFTAKRQLYKRCQEEWKQFGGSFYFASSNGGLEPMLSDYDCALFCKNELKYHKPLQNSEQNSPPPAHSEIQPQILGSPSQEVESDLQINNIIAASKRLTEKPELEKMSKLEMTHQLSVYKGCRNKVWESHLSTFKKQLNKLKIAELQLYKRCKEEWKQLGGSFYNIRSDGSLEPMLSDSDCELFSKSELNQDPSSEQNLQPPQSNIQILPRPPARSNIQSTPTSPTQRPLQLPFNTLMAESRRLIPNPNRNIQFQFGPRRAPQLPFNTLMAESRKSTPYPNRNFQFQFVPTPQSRMAPQLPFNTLMAEERRMQAIGNELYVYKGCRHNVLWSNHLARFRKELVQLNAENRSGVRTAKRQVYKRCEEEWKRLGGTFYFSKPDGTLEPMLNEYECAKFCQEQLRSHGHGRPRKTKKNLTAVSKPKEAQVTTQEEAAEAMMERDSESGGGVHEENGDPPESVENKIMAKPATQPRAIGTCAPPPTTIIATTSTTTATRTTECHNENGEQKQTIESLRPPIRPFRRSRLPIRANTLPPTVHLHQHKPEDTLSDDDTLSEDSSGYTHSILI